MTSRLNMISATGSKLVVCWFLIGTAGANYNWGYKSYNGPHTWAGNYPGCGPGRSRQSPVALPTGASNSTQVPRLEWLNFELDRTLVLQNNGKYMTLRNKDQDTSVPLPYNKGSIMDPDAEFLLDEVQFRWGQTNRDGSEHSVGGIKYPGEMTVISWNKKYKNLEQASRFPDGVIASVFFLQVQAEENVGYHLDELPNINGTSRPREIEESNYLFLFPVGQRVEDLQFFVYEGSFTTPPCTEGVLWHVYTEPVRLSEGQFAKLRSVVNSDGERLENNFRPIQPLNYRKVLMHGKRRKTPTGYGSYRSKYSRNQHWGHQL